MEKNGTFSVAAVQVCGLLIKFWKLTIKPLHFEKSILHGRNKKIEF